MEMRYFKEYSRYLNRDMEWKLYGHAGRPCLIFPCQSGRFFDWEDRGMCRLAQRWIDEGKLMLISADSIDPESWDNQGEARPRIEMQERWFNYLCEELMPRAFDMIAPQYWGKVLVGGASMGAFHAVNTYLRRPDIFNGTIALSGLYDSELFFGDYCDDLVYRNTPNRYMANFPADHPYHALYAQADRFIVCAGQGAWEDQAVASTLKLKAILESKGIPVEVDLWGYDVNHDWPWWEKQWVYFLEKTLG